MRPDNEMAENTGEGRVLDESGAASGPGPGEAMHSPHDTRSIQEQAKPLTFGEKLVGVDFNPAGDDKVKRLKQLAAEMANIVVNHGGVNINQDPYLVNTLKGHAICEILNGQMGAVKYITNRH